MSKPQDQGKSQYGFWERTWFFFSVKTAANNDLLLGFYEKLHLHRVYFYCLVILMQ